MSSLLSAIKALVLKLHFIAGLAMFIFIALMVVENDMTKRALLLLPVVLFYVLSRVLQAADQSAMAGEMMERYKESIGKK